ncbi:nuclear transport factor 2 family protein [Oceanicola sp. D3]|uniref:nuclear transport factor 2 family protein n=1 Tax=Oceanicola sp. D3 TaxID=2587163 RepID=UPI00111D7D79|nr:nuclear transport factor 2 family protein [Oceanicola sp. D3]QDC10070.1 nuclear transport factor 2 family protein [Oceanicola sp. D3]
MTEKALQQILDRQEIEAMNRQFAGALDGGTVEQFLAIFTEDVDYRSGGRVLQGHAALREFFEVRAAAGRVTRHLMSGLDIAFDGSEAALARSTWLTFAGAGAVPVANCTPFLVADVGDDCVRTAEGWRINRRVITPIFRNPEIAGPVGQIAGRP